MKLCLDPPPPLTLSRIVSESAQKEFLASNGAAPDQATVDAFYPAAMAAGGTDNGAPGLRPEYHPGYYGAFVLDPDGHNIEAVFHGAAG